jgi:hypothetical protein
MPSSKKGSVGTYLDAKIRGEWASKKVRDEALDQMLFAQQASPVACEILARRTTGRAEFVGPYLIWISWRFDMAQPRSKIARG